MKTAEKILKEDSELFEVLDRNDWVYNGVIAAMHEYAEQFKVPSLSERAVEERATLWGCYMEGTDEKGISDDILLSVHSTQAGAHENSMRMMKEYGGKHYTDKVVIHA